VLRSGIEFDVEIRVAAGADVRGGETSPLSATEGKRGEMWAIPSLAEHIEFMGKPAVVSDAISLATVPVILEMGAALYKNFGLGRSRGTIPLQIAGDAKYGGLYETAFGLTLGQIVDDIGGGTVSGLPVKAVQVGGPLGACFPRALFDTPFGYEEIAGKGGYIGHAGLTIFEESAGGFDP
jgi:formate dehydrogenase iron-sulfur subunit